VWAAAGTPTAVFPVPPATLRMLANANVAPICEVRAPDPEPSPEIATGGAVEAATDDAAASAEAPATVQNAGA
jgi:hypothetical protein